MLGCQGAPTSRVTESSLAVVTDDPLDDAGDEPPSSSSTSSSSLGPLLPPEDRIWRHPSELSGQGVAPVAPVIVGHSWGTAAFSAMGGALAVGALWFAVGNGEGRTVTERVSLVPIQTVSPRVVDADEWGSAVTATARSATVSVLSGSRDETVAGAVAYRDDGYLLTSARAIDGATSLLVVDADGVIQEARLVGTDRRTDISVLHVEMVTIAVIVADGSTLEPGDNLAIVDPAGDAVESTVIDTTSHISTADGDTVLGVVTLDTVLGDIPPGSPVVDDTGAVVGVTTATDPTAAAALIPIDIARQVAAELIDQGVVNHSWLGVTARDVEADELESGDPIGPLITSLISDGPAAVSGVMPGDVIVQVGTMPVDSVSAMVTALRYHEPGAFVTIGVVRDDRQLSFSVVLGSLDDNNE